MKRYAVSITLKMETDTEANIIGQMNVFYANNEDEAFDIMLNDMKESHPNYELVRNDIIEIK